MPDEQIFRTFCCGGDWYSTFDEAYCNGNFRNSIRDWVSSRIPPELDGDRTFTLPLGGERFVKVGTGWPPTVIGPDSNETFSSLLGVVNVRFLATDCPVEVRLDCLLMVQFFYGFYPYYLDHTLSPRHAEFIITQTGMMKSKLQKQFLLEVSAVSAACSIWWLRQEESICKAGSPYFQLIAGRERGRPSGQPIVWEPSEAYMVDFKGLVEANHGLFNDCIVEQTIKLDEARYFGTNRVPGVQRLRIKQKISEKVRRYVNRCEERGWCRKE